MTYKLESNEYTDESLYEIWKSAEDKSDLLDPWHLEGSML